METSRSSGGGGAVSARVGHRASAGGCRRKEAVGAGTLSADMDLHCDCAAETPASEQPSGKINKAAFKLFKKRKSGGTMPSFFGVKNKGDGKSSGPAGMVRSRTHDGLAEVVVLEGGRKEEPRGGGGGGGGRGGARPNPAPLRAAGGGGSSSGGGGSLAPSSSVAKSHSFFSLLRKNGRSEPGRGEPAEASQAGCKQKKGLRGLFSSMRWPRKDKRGKEEEEKKGARAAGAGGLILPGSLTASLECVKEATPGAAAAVREPLQSPGQDAPRDAAGELGGGEQAAAGAEGAPARTCREAPSPARGEQPGAPVSPGPGELHAAEDASRTGDVPLPTAPLADSECGRGPARVVPGPSSSSSAAAAAAEPPSDPSAERICLMFSDVTSLKSFDSFTGCGDIIADRDDEAGASCDRHGPGPGKPVASKKTPGVVAYQGGGEEMASPDEADDTCLQDFWDMLSQTEEQGQGPAEVEATTTAAPEATSGRSDTCPDATMGTEVAKDVSSVKRRRLNRMPAEPHPKEEPRRPEKERQLEGGVPNGDQGSWDPTTPGPEGGSAGGGPKAAVPRNSGGGDADASPAALPAAEETTCTSRLKPVSPGAITCPLRTPGSLLKDSKIPISIKHLTNLPASHPAVHQPPARSEVPRTKIPVSKVLVRRVSSRGLAGTTLRAAAACHDSAKKL
ncbi:APC membrane recruitment protein 2 [Ochotona princeps]|uniref:APC membrane recruitment protein 2 n=1 Tax=Ochotona princeps TaxID=9978 RepID=UPI002714B445|nr:APC membrane recruitment protein 2 [Ochotona princeps]